MTKARSFLSEITPKRFNSLRPSQLLQRWLKISNWTRSKIPRVRPKVKIRSKKRLRERSCIRKRFWKKRKIKLKLHHKEKEMTRLKPRATLYSLARNPCNSACHRICLEAWAICHSQVCLEEHHLEMQWWIRWQWRCLLSNSKCKWAHNRAKQEAHRRIWTQLS